MSDEIQLTQFITFLEKIFARQTLFLRAPVLTEDHTAEAYHKEVNAFVNLVIDHLPATTKWLQEIKCLQE